MKRERGVALVELLAALVVFSAALAVFLQSVAAGLRTVRYARNHLVASCVASRCAEWAREQVRSCPGKIPASSAFQDSRLVRLPDARVRIRASGWPASPNAGQRSPVWQRLEVEVSFAHRRRRPTVGLSTLVFCGDRPRDGS